jgi:dolichol-phosphate mannosyltransferase
MKLAVVIAAYDERDNIAPLTRRLLSTLAGMAERAKAAEAAAAGGATGWGQEVIFVVEGRDGTREVLEDLRRELSGFRVLYNPDPSGLGAAFRRGFAAVSPEADFVVTMDADLNHQPEEIPRLVASLAGSGDDILVGSRWVAGATVAGTPFWKLSLSRIVGFLMTHLFGLTVRDKTSGFRVYRRAALAALPFERDNFAFLPEILVLARRAGLVTREEPISFVHRVHGRSKMGLLATSTSYLSLFRTAFARRGKARSPGTDRE